MAEARTQHNHRGQSNWEDPEVDSKIINKTSEHGNRIVATHPWDRIGGRKEGKGNRNGRWLFSLAYHTTLADIFLLPQQPPPPPTSPLVLEVNMTSDCSGVNCQCQPADTCWRILQLELTISDGSWRAGPGSSYRETHKLEHYLEQYLRFSNSYSTHQNPWGPHSRSPGQDIHQLSWNPKSNCCVHNTPPLDDIPSQLNPCRILFNIQLWIHLTFTLAQRIHCVSDITLNSAVVMPTSITCPSRVPVLRQGCGRFPCQYHNITLNLINYCKWGFEFY
jgi:hypothetical protein